MILNTLVGILTGPFTFRDFSLAPLIKSAHTEGTTEGKLVRFHVHVPGIGM